jgi:hypothetical protein
MVSTSGTKAGAVLATAAGTHSGACALRWLRVQGAAVKHMSGLEAVDRDAERLSLLLKSLPALESLGVVKMYADASCTSPADAWDFLAGAARAIGRCMCLLHLTLYIRLDSGTNPMPDSFGGDLAGARTLEGLKLWIRCGGVDNLDMPPPARVSHLVAGLAGLSRLRALTLQFEYIRMDAPLPACLSRLAQLTSLKLSGFRGLRCETGWARLPALKCLEFDDCVFTVDGEDALPGIAALGALTGLSLADHNPPVFPPGILAMSRLKHLDLSHGGFEHLPEGVSVLTALEELRLGRYADRWNAVIAMPGAPLDARALGSLAGFPRLRRLSFRNCCILFCPSIEAAAMHPCLEQLRLCSSYPAGGPSWPAFLSCVGSLLQQGRLDVLDVVPCHNQAEQDRLAFCAALQAVGVPKEKLAL